MTELGIAHEIVDVPGAPVEFPRQCVIGSIGSGDRAICLHGHYDVVPASAPGQFDPRVDAETLFGRGAADMKCGLALMIHAAKSLEDAGISLRAGGSGLTRSACSCPSRRAASSGTRTAERFRSGSRSRGSRRMSGCSTSAGTRSRRCWAWPAG
ncbi:MAG: hypothetical protein CL471_09860 [Acidobacteria bacterium]|nr:hypothetical protein [Acidobacteriota bacterium]